MPEVDGQASQAEQRTQETRSFLRQVRAVTRRKYTAEEKIWQPIDSEINYWGRLHTHPRLEVDPQPGVGTLRDLLQCLGGGMNTPTLEPSDGRLRRLHAFGQLRLSESSADAGLD